MDSKFHSHQESGFKNPTILAIAFEVEDIWSRRMKKSNDWRNQSLKKSNFEEVKDWRSQRIDEVEVLETQPESATQVESQGILTWVCPSGTHRLVYRVRPIKEVDWHKDSKIDLETKKDNYNLYSTRILVNPSPIAYIKPGRGDPRETTYNIEHQELEHTR
jgi:hypothetical protein